MKKSSLYCDNSPEMSRTLNSILAGEMVGFAPLGTVHELGTHWFLGMAVQSVKLGYAYSERTFRQGVKIFMTRETLFRAQNVSLYRNAFKLSRKGFL